MRYAAVLILGMVLVGLNACGDQQQASTEPSQEAVQANQDRQTSSVSSEQTQAGADNADVMAERQTDVPEQAVAPMVESVPGTMDDIAGEVTERVDAMAKQAPAEIPAQATETTDADSAAEIAPAAGVPAADLALGQSIYDGKCKACHATGAAGAPKLDDAANWAPRLEQGMDVMVKHALEGFKGTTGYMPPKGGFMSLTDAEVTAAVAYMVSQAN